MEIKTCKFRGTDRYRMYGLVPYNLSPIQQGIQFGHAVVEYANKYFSTSDEYQEWSTQCKTFIILNGGTTNHEFDESGTQTGSLNQHLQKIQKMEMDYAYFCEQDLGDQLTAVVFLVNELVYNKKKFPDYSPPEGLTYNDWIKRIYTQKSVEELKIIELREYLQQFRMA